MKYKLIVLLILFCVIMTSGFGCKLVSPTTKKKMKPITLTVWRVFDGEDAFQDIINAYNVQHSFITIEYKKFRYSEYEKELLNAFAEDRAPDIISIQNTWVKKYQKRLKPVPTEISMVYPVVKGTLKKEVIPEIKTVRSITPQKLRETYAEVVYNDVVFKVVNDKTGALEEKIYGIPFSIDTLALYYNRELLDSAGIAKPPAYWNNEFLEDVKKLTKQDLNGQIIQAGVSLGGSNNIERYSDILSVLMMQNGAQMMAGEHISFHSVPDAYKDQKYNPGLAALKFYTDFANKGMVVYTWNKNMDNSLEMFIQGRLGLMFGYAYHLPVIKAKAQKLNFAVAKLPQIEGATKPVNFANYWVETVTSKSKHPDEAWHFIQYAAKEENVKSYLARTKKPTALRSLIDSQKEDPEIGVFADQVLTAKSWYHGSDPVTAELLLGEMIDTMASSSKPIEEVLEEGARKVEQTLNVR